MASSTRQHSLISRAKHESEPDRSPRRHDTTISDPIVPKMYVYIYYHHYNMFQARLQRLLVMMTLHTSLNRLYEELNF